MSISDNKMGAFFSYKLRYKACWLPLLSKFTETGATKGFLIVPFDREWIWHVHRLNPV